MTEQQVSIPERRSTLQEHGGLSYQAVITAINVGQIVPFLGAGANLCDRPPKTAFERGRYLPSGWELADFLLEKFGGPANHDLARVAQHAVLFGGGVPLLYYTLNQLFNINYPPTLLHKFLAALPCALRAAGHPLRYQLIVTTNYDDVLERTFHAAREPFDLITYVTQGKDSGKCRCWSYAPEFGKHPNDPEAFWSRWPPEVEPQLIKKPNTFSVLKERHVILKIHGAVDRLTPPEQTDGRLDSYVISEDDYIEFLASSELNSLLPASVVRKLHNSMFLFLGYSLRDWNMRVILHRIWKERIVKQGSWAILLETDDQELDKRFWLKRDVDLYHTPLDAFVKELISRMGAQECIRKIEERLEEMEPPLPSPELEVPHE